MPNVQKTISLQWPIVCYRNKLRRQNIFLYFQLLCAVLFFLNIFACNTLSGVHNNKSIENPSFNQMPGSIADKKQLGVVIPVYNEAECIAEVISSWDTFLMSYLGDNYVILLINDGSKDNTPAILDSLKPKHKNLTGRQAKAAC